MGLYSDFKEFRKQRAEANKAAEVPQSQLVEWQNLANWLGITDVKEDALSEATYFACMKVLCEAIGKLPIKLLQHTPEDGAIPARDHNAWRVVHDRPNPYMTATNFWSTVEYNRNHYGNAYVWIEGAGRNMRLWILPSYDVEVWYDDGCILADAPDVYYLYAGPTKVYWFGSEEILHFKSSNTFDGIVGISVREQLEKTIKGGVKSQKVVNDMYDSGFTAKAVLQYTGSLNDENVKAFLKNIEMYAKGKLDADGIGGIVPIPLGSTLTPLNINLADSQFIEVKQYTALQIASAFGVKPSQIGDYTKSSYASAEMQQLTFYIDTLLYIVKQYEEEITYKILSDEDIKKGLYFKFNVDAILRADYATKIQTLSTAVNSFLMTPNEARGKLDLDRKQGGDRLLGNGASIPVELTGSQYNNSPETTPAGNTEEGG